MQSDSEKGGYEMTRKKIAVIVVVLIAIGVGISAIWWAGGGEGPALPSAGVYINPPSLEAEPGEEITINVEVKPGERGVSGAQIYLEYDSSALEVTALEPGSFLGSTPTVGFKEISNDDGILGYAMARVGETSVPSPPGLLAIVTLNVLDSAPDGEYPLTISYVSLADEDIERIEELEIHHGAVEVK